jgi:hypothetical protein
MIGAYAIENSKYYVKDKTFEGFNISDVYRPFAKYEITGNDVYLNTNKTGITQIISLKGYFDDTAKIVLHWDLSDVLPVINEIERYVHQSYFD